MYGNADSLTCKYCYKACKTCTGGLETNCASCIVNYIFTKNNKCESKTIKIIILFNFFLRLR